MNYDSVYVVRDHEIEPNASIGIIELESTSVVVQVESLTTLDYSVRRQF